MNGTRLAGLCSLGVLVFAGCVQATGDDTDGTATNVTTMTAGMTAGMTSAGTEGDDEGTSAGDEAPATGSSGAEESSGGADSSGGGITCTPQHQCMTDAQCDGGTCLTDCTCFGGGQVDATYGPCDMCAEGEMPVGLMGLDGFCVCAPGCAGQGSACPDPGTGGNAVCALGTDAMNPTLCVIVCTGPEQCPEGDSCEMVPGQPVSICTAPAPM